MTQEHLRARITMGERSGHRPWNRISQRVWSPQRTFATSLRPELQWGNDPGTDHEIAFPNEYEVHNAHRRHLCDQNYNGGTIRAQTMEAHFPTSMKSAAHIRDILATRITMGERSGHRPWNRISQRVWSPQHTLETSLWPELQWGNDPSTNHEIAVPNEYDVQSAYCRKFRGDIHDIIATRTIMGERSGHRPGTDLGITFPNEYAVRTAHWRHPCDQNYNGAPSRAQTKCTFHHTFVHSTRTISAEGCSRANLETRITMGKRKIDKTLSPEL